jgi:hypothetical protein
MSQGDDGYRQVRALLELAWKECARDVFGVVHMYMGGMIFISAFVIFWLLNVAQFQQFMIAPPVDISGTPLFYIIMAAIYGFSNAVCTLTFLAIIVCLFEYALSFTIVCYHYDNRAWAVPKLIWNAIDKINSHFRSVREDNIKSDRKHRMYLEGEILKIRNGNTEPTKIE